MDDEDAPIPFVRNRSSRKSRRFPKGRRVSIDSTSSESNSLNIQSSTSSSLQFSYSVNSETDSLAKRERTFNKIEHHQNEVQNILRKLPNNAKSEPNLAIISNSRLSLDSVERLPVKTLREKFENLSNDEQIIFKTRRFERKIPTNDSIDEVASADEVEDIVDYANTCPEEFPPPLPDSSPPISTPSISRENSTQEVEENSTLVISALNSSIKLDTNDTRLRQGKESRNLSKILSKKLSNDLANDFHRFNSLPRIHTENALQKIHTKYSSVHSGHSGKEDDIQEPELRDKFKIVQPILDELIKTEESYVDNLLMGIKNYGNMFTRKDLPTGLRGKKFVLIGNIEQIAEFHRDEFLPMLLRNKDDLKTLFDEFSTLIDENCFYGYVLFTMNKKLSLKLCEQYKEYFKHLQNELGDKLGINSFLVQPIQRMARYPLLLQQFITTLFKHQNFYFKSAIEACCRLEKKIRTLLIMTNESEIVNDITECNDFNVFYQGKFRKVSEFTVFDHTLKRAYRSKVFIFDKCVTYTEIREKRLIFRGCYPCERIGIITKSKSFTLFYQKRKIQECDFSADQAQCDLWLELITEMIRAYAQEERRKLKEKYSKENDHIHRQPQSLSQFRNSNRFSSDSGIGNMWSLPKPEDDRNCESNRTTWYAV